MADGIGDGSLINAANLRPRLRPVKPARCQALLIAQEIGRSVTWISNGLRDAEFLLPLPALQHSPIRGVAFPTGEAS